MSMEPTFLDTISAFSSLVINIIGISMGVLTLRIWLKNRKNILFLSSILFFTLPAPWFIDFIIYFYHLIAGSTLQYRTVVYLSAWAIPILTTFWAYITSTLFKKQEWLKWIILSIFFVLDVLFYYLVMIENEWKVTTISNSVLLNIDYTQIPNLIIMIYGLFGILFVFPSYTYFSYKSENPLFKLRSGLISIGALLFSIAGVGDAILVFDNILGIMFMRFLILSALICLYFGFNTPRFVRRKYEQN